MALSSGGRRQGLWLSLSLFVLLGLAAGLRLYHLGAPSLWLDEIIQTNIASRPLWGILEGVQQRLGKSPLDFLITGLVIRISRAEWVLRLPSAIWGILSVYWLFRVGRRLHSPEMGLIAALLLAISPLHLRYSQEARFYALFVLLTLVCTEALWLAWERGSLRAWGLYTGAAILALYSHYFTAFVLGAHAVGTVTKYLVERRSAAPCEQTRVSLKRFALAIGAAALAFLPWLGYVALREYKRTVFVAPTLDWRLVEQVATAFGGSNQEWWGLWAGLAGLGLLFLFYRDIPNALLLAVWTLLPLPVIIFVNQQVSHFFHVRYVLFILPVYLLLVGMGLVAAGENVRWLIGRLTRVQARRLGAIVAVVLMLGLAVITLPQVRGYYQESREDWRAIGQMLEENARSEDTLVLLGMEPYLGFYGATAAQRGISARSVADLKTAHAAGRPLWILLTPYRERLPEAEAIQGWVSQQPNLDFDFGLGMHLYYLQAGRDRPALWQVARQFDLPAQPEVLASKGRILRSLGERRAAQQAFTQAADLAAAPARRLAFLLDAAYEAYQQKNYADALQLYDRVLALDPDQSGARIHRAVALLGLGRPAEALDELNLVLTKYHRDEYWPHRFAGDALRDLDRPAEALAHYQRALELSPDANDLRYQIGLLMERLGRIGEARAWWLDYLARQPDGPLAPAARERLAQTSTR